MQLNIKKMFQRQIGAGCQRVRLHASGSDSPLCFKQQVPADVLVYVVGLPCTLLTHVFWVHMALYLLAAMQDQSTVCVQGQLGKEKRSLRVGQILLQRLLLLAAMQAYRQSDYECLCLLLHR